MESPTPTISRPPTLGRRKTTERELHPGGASPRTLHAPSLRNADEESAATAEKKDPYLVAFDGPNDPRDAQNWTTKRKVLNTAIMTLAVMYTGIGSSLMSGAGPQVARHFGISTTLAEFANGLYVIGFGCGPLLFGPLSEVLGRKWPVAGGIFVGCMFNIATAAAPNIATVMVSRFLGGVFACSTYAVGGGFFHDIYDAVSLQVGIAFFASATAGGPALGPLVGAGFASTTEAYGWRWANWFLVAYGLSIFALIALFLDESYSHAILKNIARERRHQTGCWYWHAEVDLVHLHPRDIFFRYVLRPIKMLFLEPILTVITIYSSFVYALLYMLMAALPVIYGEYRGMGELQSMLPMIAVYIGILIGGGIIILDARRYGRHLATHNITRDPEQRYLPMGLGGVLLTVGLFWFAFTGPAQAASAWPSIVALAVCMVGCVLVFECSIIVMVDTFTVLANSAIAASAIVRSIFGGTFGLFTPGMVHNLGWQSTWAMALVAFLALAMAPIPLVFFYTGKRLRAMSKFTYEL